MRSGSSVRSCRGPIKLGGGLENRGGAVGLGKSREGRWREGVGDYIEIAFSAEDVADFFVDVEVFFVKHLDH
jgi:hypothetical protein